MVDVWPVVHRVADHRLDEFGEIILWIENKLRSDVRTINLKASSESLRSDEAEELAIELDSLTKTFPQDIRRSMFVAVHSFLEQEIINACKQFEPKYKVKLEDIRKDGTIGQARRYLEKIVEVEFPESSPSWQAILRCIKLRNWFVHNGPRLGRKADKKTVKTIKQIKHIAIDEEQYLISVEANFCAAYIEIVRTFLSEFYKAIRERRRELKKLYPDQHKG